MKYNVEKQLFMFDTFIILCILYPTELLLSMWESGYIIYNLNGRQKTYSNDANIRKGDHECELSHLAGLQVTISHTVLPANLFFTFKTQVLHCCVTCTGGLQPQPHIVGTGF